MNVLTSLIVKRDVLTKGLLAEIASNNRFQCLKWHNYRMEKEENQLKLLTSSNSMCLKAFFQVFQGSICEKLPPMGKNI